MKRRLTGAALTNAVVRNLRAMLATDYGLPMSEYDVRDVWKGSIGSDMQPPMSVVFRRRQEPGSQLAFSEITIDNIIPGDDGSLDQYSRPELG